MKQKGIDPETQKPRLVQKGASAPGAPLVAHEALWSQDLERNASFQPWEAWYQLG